MFGEFSSTTWKLISGFLVAIIITLSVTVCVKSCQSTEKDNKRLEEIDQLNKEITKKTEELENVQKRMEGLKSEIESQKAVIVSRDSEIEALKQRSDDEKHAVEVSKTVVEKVYETVKEDKEAYNWFDQALPDSIIESISCLNTVDSRVNSCM